MENDTIFYKLFTHFGALWGPLGASLGTIFPPKCYEGAGGNRFWTRFGDFCMVFYVFLVDFDEKNVEIYMFLTKSEPC